MSPEAKRSGAVYDDPSTRLAVSAIMERCGFVVTRLHGPASELVEQARLVSPEVVVVDIASGGSRGLGIVGDVRAAVPACAGVLLAPFEGLRDSAREAGAYDLVGTDDLRDFERCLRRLGAELSAKESATRSTTEPRLFGDGARHRDAEQEAVAVVREVAPAIAGERPSDGEAQARATFAVQAHETLEDLPDGCFGDT